MSHPRVLSLYLPHIVYLVVLLVDVVVVRERVSVHESLVIFIYYILLNLCEFDDSVVKLVKFKLFFFDDDDVWR